MEKLILLNEVGSRVVEDEYGQMVQLRFADELGESAVVTMDFAQLKNVLAHLMTHDVTGQVDEALPVSEAATPTLPATQTALLVATDADVVRWEAGGSIVRMNTASGVALQIALKPEIQAFLAKRLS